MRRFNNQHVLTDIINNASYYLTDYNNEIILLDLKRDVYLGLDAEASRNLVLLLEKKNFIYQ